MFLYRIKQGILGMLLACMALISWAGSLPPNTLRIHYYRAQNDYAGWGMHVWGDGIKLPSRITWKEPLLPAGQNDQGIYFDIRVMDSNRVVNYILHQGDVKHPSLEVHILPSRQGFEVWQIEDEPRLYFTRPPQFDPPAPVAPPVIADQESTKALSKIEKSLTQIKSTNTSLQNELSAAYKKKLEEAAEQEYQLALKRIQIEAENRARIHNPPAAVETPETQTPAETPTPYYLWGALVLLILTWTGITVWQSLRIINLNRNRQTLEAELRSAVSKLNDSTTEIDQTRQQVLLLEKRLNTVFTQAADALLILSIELGDSYRIVAVNRAFCRQTGLQEVALVGQRLDEILTEEGRRGELPRRIREVVRRCEPVQFEERIEFPSGLLMLDQQLTPIQAQPGFCSHILLSARVKKDNKNAQEHWQHYSHFDALTGLANRTQLQQKLTQTLKNFSRHSDGALAVIIINIDGFRHINDRYGFEVGDYVLQTVAQRLRGSVREVDSVARLGTDEFAVVLDDGTSPDVVNVIAEKLLTNLQRHIPHNDQMIQLSASLGLALYPEDGTTANNLLKHADMAMRKTKERGGNAFMLYSGRFKQQGLERLALEGHLRRGLLHKEFNFVYQPIFSNASDKIIGVEALLRWQHPDFGIVLPSQFLSIAESIGNMPALLDWGLQQLIADWPTLARLQPDLQLSLNISSSQFQHPEFLSIVKKATQQFSFQKNQLVFDIAESTLLSDVLLSDKNIKELNAMGVAIAIDNFGLGQSGFSVLKRFKAQSIKLDRSLIHEIPRNSQTVSAVQSIVLQAKALNFQIIAKGIEEPDQKAFMQESGCFGLQGNFLGTPIGLGQLLASHLPNGTKIHL